MPAKHPKVGRSAKATSTGTARSHPNLDLEIFSEARKGNQNQVCVTNSAGGIPQMMQSDIWAGPDIGSNVAREKRVRCQKSISLLLSNEPCEAMWYAMRWFYWVGGSSS
jgi:hypothetical protein